MLSHQRHSFQKPVIVIPLLMQTALYPESAAAVSASDVGILAWKGDLLALGVFEEAITPAGKGEGALCFFPSLICICSYTCLCRGFHADRQGAHAPFVGSPPCERPL